MAILGVDHLTVVTADLEATHRFYAELIGLRAGPSMGTPNTRWFYALEKPLVHVLHHEQSSSLAHLGNKTGLDHIALTVRDFDGLQHRLFASGTDVRSQTIGNERRPRLFATDPNGIVIEFRAAGS